MQPTSPTQIKPGVAVAVFPSPAQASQALQALRTRGFADDQLGALLRNALGSGGVDGSGLLTGPEAVRDPASVLLSLGVPDGEARFYVDEVQEGKSLVVARAPGEFDAARDVLLRNGGDDVQSLGRELVRGDDTDTDAAIAAAHGAAVPPPDATTRWEDVRSRYETMFDQHYGTRGTWDQFEPLYQAAWDLANAPAYRGRRWAEVESAVQREWQAQNRGAPWADAVGPVRDVFEDVADEARRGLEGGADFSTRKPRE